MDPDSDPAISDIDLQDANKKPKTNLNKNCFSFLLFEGTFLLDDTRIRIRIYKPKTNGSEGSGFATLVQGKRCHSTVLH
jgi:hypothetical protein